MPRTVVEYDMETLSYLKEQGKKMWKDLESASKNLPATTSKKKIAPLMNRLQSFDEWISTVEDKDLLDQKLREIKTTPEGRQAFRNFLKGYQEE